MSTHCTPVEPDVASQPDVAAAPDALNLLRLVLDTNAVLDWLLFRDQGFLPIAAAIESGAAVALTDEVCVEELRRVLRYPEFKLDEARQAELMKQYLQHVRVVEAIEASSPDENEMSSTGIPRCKDPDDQKFLELASQQAAILVTKDKLLLKLARRVAKGGRFLILRPDLLLQRHFRTVRPATDPLR